MQEYLVLIEEKVSYSKIIIADSEEDAVEKAGQLSTSIKSSSLSLDDQKISTNIIPL